MLHGLLVHADIDTPGEPAAATLVPVGLVHQAAAALPGLARVVPSLPDRALEEARAPVAGKDAVVLAGAVVSAHLNTHVVFTLMQIRLQDSLNILFMIFRRRKQKSINDS